MNITKNEFDKIRDSPEQIFLKFSASWCGPCKRYAPVFDEFVNENPSVKAYSVDCDEARDLAEDFDVKSIPCTIVVKNGEIQHLKNGVLSKQDLSLLID